MNVKKVGRGYFFSFEEPYKTNIYVIEGENDLYFLDTFLGPDPMKDVLGELEKLKVPKKNIIVFNSHFDYDHVWGNCLFNDSLIFSHYKCKTLLMEKGPESLEKYKSQMQGDVKLVLPNLTFRREITFQEDELTFFYSPGHTEDSSSCFDHKSKVLFVADNLENPFPYIRTLDIDEFIESLNRYLEYKPEKIISGHDGMYENSHVINKTIEYFRKFKQRTVDISKFTEAEKYSHYTNLKTYGTLLEEEKRIQEALSFYEEAMDVLTSLPEKNEQIVNEKKTLEGIILRFKS